MTTKQVLFRLDDSKLIALDNKLSDKGISKQFFLSKCVELFLEDKLSFDNNVITNDSSEIVELKKQIAIINKRLSKLEGDSNIKDGDNSVIAIDKTITDSSLDNNDNSVIASDNSPRKSNEPLGIEKTEIGLVDNILSAVKHKEDITISELPILPLNEDLGVIVPDTENEGDNSDIVSSDDELVNSESAVTENEDTVNCDSGNKIGSLTDAIDNVILPELAKDKDMSHSAIAKLLYKKYYSSLSGKSSKWQGSLINRALQYRKDGKA